MQIYYIPSGVDFSQYSVGNNKLQFRVIFLSRMEKLTKGLNTLVKVIKKTYRIEPAIKFVLLGTGKDSETARKLSEHLDSVEYMGFVDDKIKARELCNGNLMVSTSNIEPFPLNVLEGLASGLPIVCTDYSGSWAIKQCDCFGSVSELKTEDIVMNILSYYNEWALRKEEYFREKLSRRNSAIVLYDSKVMMENYRSCFNSIIRQ